MSGAVTPVIQDFGQRHAIDTGRFCDLLHGDASRLRELHLLHLLGELESNHCSKKVTNDNKKHQKLLQSFKR